MTTMLDAISNTMENADQNNPQFGPRGNDLAATFSNIIKNNVINDVQTKNYITFCLAPSYGKLNKESIKSLDDNLKIMLIGTIKELQTKTDYLPAGQTLSWDDVLSVMCNNNFIQPDEDSVPIFVDQTYERESTDDFNFDGGADSSVVQEIKSWVYSVINDDDIINSTSINEDTVVDLCRIVSEKGAHVDSVDDIFAKTQYTERTLVDIGVIRFPDVDHPFLKVYRLCINCHNKCKRILFHEENSSGIRVMLNSRKFIPRKSVIGGMMESIKQKAVQECENMFSW
ncbi:hypothetical protein ATCVNEJV2_275R [Acanthocystis turfacea Chlorella virus NE-JV-2]|nr:hypothetical protein ATCVNEJV2_275R [Acanthocystis turfacea Chlorella virus NE-JV-2]